MRFLFNYVVLLLLLIYRMPIRPAIVFYSIAIARLLDFSIMFMLYIYSNYIMLNIVTIYIKKKVL